MKSGISKAICLAVLTLPLSTMAMEVKGLQLGAPYTEDQLSQSFPGAKCFPHGTTSLTYCSLPTTFLGRPTKAEVMRDKDYRLIDFTAFLPVSDEPGVLQVLNHRFGLSSALGNKHIWQNAADGKVRIEAGIVNNQLRINFYSSKIPQLPPPLQADDM